MAVQVDISFAIDLGAISESVEALHSFKQSVVVTIAASLGIAPGRVQVISVEAGSVIVVVEITAASEGSQEMTPVAAAVALQQKLVDSNDSIRRESDVFASALGVVGMSIVTYGDTDVENSGETVLLSFDCAGVVGGNATRDHCGICDDDVSTDCIADCAGVWGGSSSFDRCGECAGDDSCVDCRGVPFGGATDDDCTALQSGSGTLSNSENIAVGLIGRRSAAGGEASNSGDGHGLIEMFAVCVGGGIVAIAVMCVLKPNWLPSPGGCMTSVMRCGTCRRWCAPLQACLSRCLRRAQLRRARGSAKVSATTRRQAYAYETGSTSDDYGGLDDDAISKTPLDSWASGSKVIAKAGRAKQKDWRIHTPELQPSSEIPSNIDPISKEMLQKIDWIAAKARLKEG